MYRLKYKKSVRKDVRRIPQAVQKLLQKRIKELSLDPCPIHSKPLKGYVGFYRVRVGDYRVLYRVSQSDEVITIYKIGHRRDIYRNL